MRRLRVDTGLPGVPLTAGRAASSRRALAALRRFLPGLLWLLLLGILYSDPLFVRRNFGGRDLLGYHLPIEKAVHDAYSRGRWPVWITEVSGGRPLLPNINAGALYPIRLLLSPIPFPLAMRIYPVLHWALAGLGLMALLRTTRASRPAQWVGAVTYVFSGVVVSQTFYTNTQPGVTLLPWVVWSVARPSRTAVGRILPLSFLLGLDFLAGDLFTTGLALLAAVLWVVLEEERASRSVRLAALAAAVGLASLLALPQLIATLLWIPETHRAVTGMKLGEALRFSVSPWRLLELFVPFPFGPTWAAEPQATWARPAFGGLAKGFFSTLYAGSFAACGLLIGWRRNGRGLGFARGLIVASCLLCVLPSLAPAAWDPWAAPLPLRYPEKVAVGIAFGAAVFAGSAFDQLRASRDARRWPLALGAGFAVASGAAMLDRLGVGRAAVALLGADPSFSQAAAAHLPGAIAEGGLLWMSAVVALDCLRRPERLGLGFGLLLACLSPIAANRRIAQSFREGELFAPSPFARAIDRRDPSRAYRALGQSRYVPPSRFESAQMSSDVAFLDYPRRNWLFYTPVLWGRGLVFNDDFDAGDLSRLESLRRLSFGVSQFAEPGAFFGNVSLRFGIRFPDQPPAPGFRRFGGNGFEAWDENPQALPDLRLLQRWRDEPGALAALNDIPLLEPGEVALETGGVGGRSARAGVLRVLEKSPEVLRVETEAPDPTYLFALRGFWSHRLVRVDGHPAAVVPALLAFSAVPVPAGHHRIEWKEQIPGGEVSLWGPVSFGILAGAVLIRGRLREPGL